MTNRIHITNLYGMGGTAKLAQDRATEVARQLGFRELPVAYDERLRDPDYFDKKVDGILTGLEFGDTVIFQSPVWITSKVERDFIDRVRLYQGKVVIFINDVPPMMFAGNRELMPLFIELYNKADLLIVSSENMKKYLISKGVTVKKFVIQNLWDIPVDFISNSETKYMSRINFAGSNEKFKIVEKLQSSDIDLEIYDHKPEDKIIPENIHYHGYVNETKLLAELHEGGFGLVWSEDEQVKNYMHYCNSYKVSTYLRAGIPLIVHNNISCRKLVEDNHWGIVVDSLEEAVERVKAMSEDEYRKYAESVSKVSALLRDSYFTKKMLIDTIYKL
ncbi:nucleotide sugar synthetase [Ligilactobacillus salivarius]|uniref:nucleotide sugar synthetase n=1 Tax=Ligilactobacillus salivarius TaxID=1624 RepID=UPI002097CBCF|nr:nucleotide sugar synthetase [Ligilactobacillus salivarius]MCO7135735.1 nucleotide sugar synthetase [Ligilactobacillus salivarius]